MKTYIAWILIVCFLGALVGIFIFFLKFTSGTPLDISLVDSTTSTSSGQAGSPQATTTIDLATSATETPPTVPDGYKQYTNSDYHFSIYYPPDTSPQESHDRGFATTIAFQSAPGEPGFQIYVAPINGNTITPQRFTLDEPSGIILDQQNSEVDGAQAVTFTGFNATVGQTHETWFIHGGFLFEITTYKELTPWLESQILPTFRFQN